VFSRRFQVNLSGGTLLLNYNNALNALTPITLTGGALAMNGFTDTVSTVSLRAGASQITGPGTLTSSATFDVQDGYVSAVLAGTTNAVGLNKTTGGTVTLDGLNTYTGPTNVTGGKLLVNGSLFGSSAVTVSGGGTLGGNGNLSPGASPGTLGLRSLVFGSNVDTYIVDIVSPTSYDNAIFDVMANLWDSSDTSVGSG
jgi:autotransporter-associated beta strand protein